MNNTKELRASEGELSEEKKSNEEKQIIKERKNFFFLFRKVQKYDERDENYQKKQHKESNVVCISWETGEMSGSKQQKHWIMYQQWFLGKLMRMEVKRISTEKKSDNKTVTQRGKKLKPRKRNRKKYSKKFQARSLSFIELIITRTFHISTQRIKGKVTFEERQKKKFKGKHFLCFCCCFVDFYFYVRELRGRSWCWTRKHFTAWEFHDRVMSSKTEA